MGLSRKQRNLVLGAELRYHQRLSRHFHQKNKDLYPSNLDLRCSDVPWEMVQILCTCLLANFSDCLTNFLTSPNASLLSAPPLLSSSPSFSLSLSYVWQLWWTRGRCRLSSNLVSKFSWNKHLLSIFDVSHPEQGLMSGYKQDWCDWLLILGKHHLFMTPFCSLIFPVSNIYINQGHSWSDFISISFSVSVVILSNVFTLVNVPPLLQSSLY